jgi:Kef-type K+ transport system membrane component KefB
LFVPIFFINIGLTVNLHDLQLNAVWLILAVTLAAIAGKVFGAAAGARLGGFPGHAAFQLGSGMVARGEVTLIVAVVLLSTLVTPPMLHFAFERFRPKPVVAAAEPSVTIEEIKK